MYSPNANLIFCFDWLVPAFILWDIFGESAEYFGGRQTYSLDVLGVPYPTEGMSNG